MTEKDNMEKWNKLKRPPKSALRPIKGGRLGGMSNISPMWRYKIMTQTFGMCGGGWGYDIKRFWTEPGEEGQVFMFCEIVVKVGEKRIPGVGGSMLISKEKKGLHHNDEAPKMALTDALSTALKMIGVAADIYMDLWDGSKYTVAPEEITITAEQIDKLSLKLEKTNTSLKDFNAYFGIPKIHLLPKSEFNAANKMLDKKMLQK